MVITHITKSRKKSRRWGDRPINRRRDVLGEYETLFQEMQDDEEYFFKYTRMNKEIYQHLLAKVTPYLLKRSRRKPLTPGHRLSMTLRYLATGNDLFSIATAYRVGESTLRKVIQETCIALIKVLVHEYLKSPTREDWIRISEGFRDIWNLPNCAGAIDGKHITIKAPANSGSLFFNYKKTFSTVLMAICDHEYKFSLVDIGSFGSCNDAGIFQESLMPEGLFNGFLNLPDEQFQIPNSNITTPIFLVGDNIFPLSTKLMKPYPGSFLNEEQKVFNYRLSRARRIVENA
ncbi:uncharacterized protein LOC127285696 [Leptopilina boulardi]|uniref:uncharacterized protein LOC127285696 n=1 Tax=Leptopilina boulardi TaxID=63433 RepID=UPI0021F5E230|nr:uncharacterized protein LOC127285696 [Leptopilina boulardi]